MWPEAVDEAVRVHRVAHPQDRDVRVPHGAQERRQQIAHPVGPEAGDQRQPARNALRVEALAQGDDLLGRRRRADLDSDRVVEAREELDVSALELACALPDPEEVAGAGVPVAGRRVLAHERLLVVEQQRLVARPHVHLVDGALVGEIDSDRPHEAERPADLVRDRLVAAALQRAGHELLVPGVHLRQVGEATLRERAQQVEGGDGLVVRLHHALGVGDSRLGRRLVGVHGVPAERGQLHPVDHLDRRGARLRELAGEAADLDHGQRGAVGQHGGHLQQHLQPLPDRDHRHLAERLGAVARLEQERPPFSGLAEGVAKRSRLTGEDQRGQLAQPIAHGLDGVRLRPVGLLERRVGTPRRGRPGGVGHGHRLSVVVAVLTLRAKTARYEGRMCTLHRLSLFWRRR